MRLQKHWEGEESGEEEANENKTKGMGPSRTDWGTTKDPFARVVLDMAMGRAKTIAAKRQNRHFSKTIHSRPEHGLIVLERVQRNPRLDKK
jgi:hypothetical protein